MFPLWWGNKYVTKLFFSDFLTGRITESPAISLNIIFIHVRFFVRTCEIAFDHHNRRHKRTLFGLFEQSDEHYWPGCLKAHI